MLRQEAGVDSVVVAEVERTMGELPDKVVVEVWCCHQGLAVMVYMMLEVELPIQVAEEGRRNMTTVPMLVATAALGS